MDLLILCKILLIFGALSGAFLLIIGAYRKWSFEIFLGLPFGLIIGDLTRVMNPSIPFSFMFLILGIYLYVKYHIYKKERKELEDIIDRLERNLS